MLIGYTVAKVSSEYITALAYPPQKKAKCICTCEGGS